ncbi:MAG TPA: SDR family NAD(P)-dependent oxidoreductase [Candidatus Binataceae bacterium]|nr:SDR family NAD(P)-dependent oxidoreductase [Candidatus Binataceae bacterium]
MKSFDHKIAAITGAGSGIGRALALDLARQNCALALSDINEKVLAETAALITPHQVKMTTCKVDVADRTAVHAWADRVVRDHAGVNLIFNNAGVAHAGAIEDTDYADYEWIMGINFWGVVYGTKAFLPHLKKSGDGHIVNVSSIFGIFAQPAMSAYNASKFAVRGFTESLRQELDLMKCGVSATCVHPGGIKTNIAINARMTGSMLDIAKQDEQSRKEATERLFRTPPEKAAQRILAGVRRNARRVLIGPDAAVLDKMQRMLPTSYQRLVTASVRLARAKAD